MHLSFSDFFGLISIGIKWQLLFLWLKWVDIGYKCPIYADRSPLKFAWALWEYLSLFYDRNASEEVKWIIKYFWLIFMLTRYLQCFSFLWLIFQRKEEEKWEYLIFYLLAKSNEFIDYSWLFLHYFRHRGNFKKLPNCTKRQGTRKR